MAKLDHEIKVRVVYGSLSTIVWLVCIAAVLIAGMHYGYECGCP